MSKKINKQELYSKTIEETLNRCASLLTKKQEEYAPDEDPLANFKKGAKVSGLTEEQVLYMYCVKHLVSIRDIVFGVVPSSRELIQEKTGDIINYMTLLNCITEEKLSEKQD